MRLIVTRKPPRTPHSKPSDNYTMTMLHSIAVINDYSQQLLIGTHKTMCFVEVSFQKYQQKMSFSGILLAYFFRKLTLANSLIIATFLDQRVFLPKNYINFLLKFSAGLWVNMTICQISFNLGSSILFYIKAYFLVIFGYQTRLVSLVPGQASNRARLCGL